MGSIFKPKVTQAPAPPVVEEPLNPTATEMSVSDASEDVQTKSKRRLKLSDTVNNPNLSGGLSTRLYCTGRESAHGTRCF